MTPSAQMCAYLIELKEKLDLLATAVKPSDFVDRGQAVQEVYKGFDEIVTRLATEEAEVAYGEHEEEVSRSLSELVRDATGKVYISQVAEITTRLVRRYYEVGYVDACLKASPGSNISWPDIVTSDMVDAAQACGPLYTKEKMAKGILAAFLFSKEQQVAVPIAKPKAKPAIRTTPRWPSKPSKPDTDEKWLAAWVDRIHGWEVFLDPTTRSVTPEYQWSAEKESWIPYDPNAQS